MSDPRYKLPAETRKFGGKVYKYLIVGNKAEVTGDAKRWKLRGFAVRITPWRGKYAVYIRRQ